MRYLCLIYLDEKQQTAENPVSVIAQASSNGNPNLSSNCPCRRGLTPAPKPKPKPAADKAPAATS